MKIGDMVQILDVDDARDLLGDKRFSGRDSEIALREVPALRLVGRVGRIVEVLTQGATGETPDDPLFVVDVPALGRDGFWREELKMIMEARP